MLMLRISTFLAKYYLIAALLFSSVYTPVQAATTWTDVQTATNITSNSIFAYQAAKTLAPYACTAVAVLTVGVGNAPCWALLGLTLTVGAVISGLLWAIDNSLPTAPPNTLPLPIQASLITPMSHKVARANPDPNKWNSAPATGGNPTPKPTIAPVGNPTFATATNMSQVYALCDGTKGPNDCTLYTTDGTAKMQYHISVVPSTAVSAMPATDAGGLSKVGTSTASTVNGVAYTKVAYNSTFGTVQCDQTAGNRVYDTTTGLCTLIGAPDGVLKPAGTICETYWDDAGVLQVDSNNGVCNRGNYPIASAPNSKDQANLKIRICGTNASGKAYCVYAGDVTNASDPQYAGLPAAETPSASNPGREVQIDDGTTITGFKTGPFFPDRGGWTVTGTSSKPSTGDPTHGGGTNPVNGSGSVIGGGGTVAGPGTTGGTGTSSGTGVGCGAAGQASCGVTLDSSNSPDIPTGDTGTGISASANSAYATATTDKTGDHDVKWGSIFSDLRFGVPEVACENPPLIFTFGSNTYDMTINFCDQSTPIGKILALWKIFIEWALGFITIFYIWRRFLSAEQIGATE